MSVSMVAASSLKVTKPNPQIYPEFLPIMPMNCENEQTARTDFLALACSFSGRLSICTLNEVNGLVNPTCLDEMQSILLTTSVHFLPLYLACIHLAATGII